MRPRPTTSTHFPYTTLFRSLSGDEKTAGELLGWNVAQARANSDAFAVAHDREDNYVGEAPAVGMGAGAFILALADRGDRKSTRLNSSHGYISYAVFCLKKKK